MRRVTEKLRADHALSRGTPDEAGRFLVAHALREAEERPVGRVFLGHRHLHPSGFTSKAFISFGNVIFILFFLKHIAVCLELFAQKARNWAVFAFLCSNGGSINYAMLCFF